MKTTTNENLARAIKAAARSSDAALIDPAGTRTFLADVHAELAAAGLKLSLAELKAAAVELQKAGLLTLTRCDLVTAFPVELVAASEVERMGARFHFVTV